MIKKILILLLLYFIFLYFYTWRNLLTIKDNSNYPVRYLYKDNIKTGDVFLLSNTKNNRILGDLIFMVNFVHPSVALWSNDNLYILEYAIYPTKSGFIKIPFEEWISFNKNKNILHNCLDIENNEKRDILGKKMLNFYYQNKDKINKKNRTLDITWLRFPLRIKRDLNLNSTSCTEVLAELFYNIGMAKKDKGISYYHQSDFIGLRGFKLENKFSYSKIYLCKFQHLMKKYI